MPRFFVRNGQIEEKQVAIVGDDAHHISRALRMAAGEHIIVCDESGREYDCTLSVFSDDRVIALIDRERESTNEPCFYAHLFQGLPKGDKLDLIIQKSVECGVSEVTTFESEFCIAKAKADSEEKKLERRQRIALEAAKQCGRGAVPKINKTINYDSMIKLAQDYDIVLFCYEGEGTLPIGEHLKRLPTDKKAPRIAVIVGPEGGFSESEAKRAAALGFAMCGLGKRILRTETASIFALCCIAYSRELS